MAEIPTIREDIKGLKGVHLYHFAMSNCSQRVRIALEEKDVKWTSHSINLSEKEHLTPEFRQINPRSLVPVLIHDGRTIVESNDIITYIDETFPGPQLMPADKADQAYVEKSLKVSDGIQTAVKLVSHEFLFKPARRMNAEQLAEFEKICTDAELLRFMRDWSAEGGFPEERIRNTVAEFTAAFAELDRRLASHPWLSGANYGLADISWTVNIHRLNAMRFPFKRYPRLNEWYKRIQKRPSFKNALKAYDEKPILAFFATYSQMRRLQRTAITNYL